MFALSLSLIKGTCAPQNQQIKSVNLFILKSLALHHNITYSSLTFLFFFFYLAYVISYSTTSSITTSTPGFVTVVQFVKISPTLIASTGLLSAVLTQTELTKYLNDQYNEYKTYYSW